MLFDPEVEELFRALCVLSPQDRRIALDAAPPALRERVERLLELDAYAGEAFATQSGDVWATDPVPPDTIPETVGGFRIVQRIGAGGMGVVYEAEQEHPRRRVAIKLIHPTVRNDDALHRFRYEAQALAQVNHPGVPAIYEAGETDDGLVYLAMEMVRGPTLKEWAGLKHTSPHERVELVIALADAVQAAHDAGVLHRDLKPANIVVTPVGPKVLDFGIASPLAEPGSGRQPGTPAYMSPEALAGERVDARVDVYALGVIAHELMSAEPLDRSDPRCMVEDVPPDVGLAIARAVDPAPASRTPSAAALSQDLQDALAWRALPWAGGMPYRARRALRRHRTGVVFGSLVAALVLAATLGPGVYAWQQDRARAQLAQRHLAQLEASIEAAGPTDVERLQEMVRRFVEDPTHRGTPAESQAWMALAHRLDTLDAPGQREALASAFLTASDPSQARLQLARYFDDACDYDALWQMQNTLDDDVRSRLAPELTRASVNTRHFTQPGLVEQRPEIAALIPTTRLGITAEKAGLLMLPGRDTPAILAINQRLELFDVGATEPFWSVLTTRPEAWATRDNIAIHEGHTYLAWGNVDGASIERLRLGDAASLERIAPMAPSQIQRLVSARGPDGPLLLAARSYPERALTHIDVQTGELGLLLPSLHLTDSDVMDVRPFDFDGDGVDELVVSMGAWEAYDLRVLGHTDAGWSTLARLRTGTINSLDIVRDAQGLPLIVGGKSDEEANLRLFPEDAPYGPPAGVYAWRFDGTSLTQAAHWPVPVRDLDGPGVLVETPTVGDFDGDGRVDVAWTLKRTRHDAEESLWLQWDIAGDAHSDVITGLEVLDALDVDGDGDDELLVGDENKELWLLGSGSDRLTPWEPAAVTSDVAMDLAAGDPWVARLWSRAMELTNVGLLREAASALQTLNVATDSDEVLRKGELMAARLLERAGDARAAASAYERAVALGADEARPDLVHAYLHTLDFDRAMMHFDGDPDWLDGMPAPPSVDLLADSMAAWHLERPGTLRDTAPDLAIDVFNDEGVIARLPVTVESKWVQLDLGLHIDVLELGAGLALELVQDGRTRLGVAAWGQGGGGVTQLYQQCGHDVWEHFERQPMPSSDESVTLKAARIGPVEMTRCRANTGGQTRLLEVRSEGIELGPAELVLRAYGDATYSPPTRARLTLDHMSSLGLTAREVPVTPHQRAVRALFEGELGAEPPDTVAAEWAIARGDADALEAAVRELPEVHQRWLLRRHGAVAEPILRSVLGDEFTRVYAEAFTEASNTLSRPAVQEALLRPPLSAIDATTAPGRLLRVRRAQAHMLRGERGAARSIALTVVDAGEYDAATRDAMLLLARLTCDEPDTARGWVERAAAADAVPESVWDRTRRFPELAELQLTSGP